MPNDLTLPNVRKMFIPDPGMIIGDFDLAQADAQVVAWEANDEELKAIFRDPSADLHAENAKTIFGKLTDKYRKLAKAGVHATNYGSGARTLASALGITVHEAERFQRRWFEAHPGIKEWHQRTLHSLQTKRMVTNAFGFRRYYFDRIEGLLPEALAWVPQCVPLDHEVLTRNGWKQIAEVRVQEQIAIWQEGLIRFETPQRWNVGETKELVKLHGCDYLCTPNHRVPYYNAGRSSLQVATANSLPTGARVPRCGLYEGEVAVPKEWITYFVAFQADGRYDATRDAIQFEFSKGRKIARLQEALDELDIPYTKSLVRRGATLFYIPKGKHGFPNAAFYKVFGDWLLALDGDSLDAFLEELEFWDGWRSPQGELWYSSKVKQNCEWVATIAALRGKRARWLSTDNRGKNPVYRLTIAPNKGKRSAVTAERIAVSEPVVVACPTVSSGFFLLRYNGEISVTGNSTVALVIDKGLVNIYKNLPKVEPLLQVHDSLVLQWEKRYHPHILREIKREMEIVVPYEDPLVIPVGAAISDRSWGAVRDVDWDGNFVE